MTAYAMPAADPTAVVGRRIAAWFIDLLIYMLIGAAAILATGGVSHSTTTYDTSSQATEACSAYQRTSGSQHFCFANGDEVNYYKTGGPGILLWVGHLIAYALIQGILGGSLGKLALGLRVVDEKGQVAGIGKSFLRTILWVVDAVTCGLPIVGGIMIASTKGHRRVGDMAAGTYVVAKSSVGIPIGQVPQQGYAPQGYAGQGWPAPGAPAGPAWGGPEQPAQPAQPASEGPTWDEARNTYIQYDRAQARWVQWDSTANEWRPIAQ